MEAALKQSIDRQLHYMLERLRDPMGSIGANCAMLQGSAVQLDLAMANNQHLLPKPQLMYVVNRKGQQISGNVLPDRIDATVYGQDLSARPYLQRSENCAGLSLSDVYLSRVNRRACITALQPLVRDGDATACLCVDFDLADLADMQQSYVEQHHWRQLKGDPAIRGNLFKQERVYSAMDARLDDVCAIVEQLICEKGIFHAKLHFSSSRATLWHFDNPFEYHIHVLDEIIDPAVCLAYSPRPYDERATVAVNQIAPIFQRFQELRNADSTIYLRAGSINVVNGMVGLNFSCDGSHYMPAEEFLDKPLSFWFGAGEV